MANNTVIPSLRGATRFGKGVSQVTGTGTPKRGGELGLTRVRESYVINASSASQPVLIADSAMELVAVKEVHSVVGGAAAALQIEKLTGTQAPGGGTVMLTGTLDLTASINTVRDGTLVATAATLQLAAGDRIAWKFSGTLTGLVGAAVLVFRRLP